MGSSKPKERSEAMAQKKDDLDLAGMGYEAARDELAQVASQLERGNLTLEESLALWERGDALAAVCEAWLKKASDRIEATED